MDPNTPAAIDNNGTEATEDKEMANVEVTEQPNGEVSRFHNHLTYTALTSDSRMPLKIL